jgi:hypothetical protein
MIGAPVGGVVGGLRRWGDSVKPSGPPSTYNAGALAKKDDPTPATRIDTMVALRCE